MIIENLSGRKIAVLLIVLLLCQLTCFLIGGIVAPMPANAQNILGTVCKDTSTVKNDTTKWFYNRGKGKCKTVDLGDTHHDLSEKDVVFVFQMPVPRESKTLDYSRWQQNLIAVLQVDMKYHSHIEVPARSTITIDARLAYRNKGDPEDKWTLYTQSIEKRNLDCDIDTKSEEYLYNCSAIPLFELGSLFHDFYLLNVRLPTDTPTMNSHIGHIQDLWLTVINQNGGFTKVWLSLKTVFFPCIIAILVWFWRRIHMLSRKPVLLEKMLLSLGIALSLLNVPLEFLTLHFDLPFMSLLKNIRQHVFYVTLFWFWIVFSGEQMTIQDDFTQSSLKRYTKHLTTITLGCISLFIFHIWEGVVQLKNPFYCSWVTVIGATLATIVYISFRIFIGVYFLFLCYMIKQVIKNTSYKTQSFQKKYSVKCENHEVIFYRLKFLALATILCAALTLIAIILDQVTELQWKWDEDIELENTSAFFTGVYGMWNIYIFALLVLYAPSHKQFSAVTQV